MPDEVAAEERARLRELLKSEVYRWANGHHFLNWSAERGYVEFEYDEQREDDDNDVAFVDQYLSYRNVRYEMRRAEQERWFDELATTGELTIKKPARVEEGFGWDRGAGVKLIDRKVQNVSEKEVEQKLRYHQGALSW
ncbi:hypothetical protein ACFLQU_04510 [Verrucomicrobiota bacterium]